MNNPLKIILVVTLTLILSVGLAITGCSSNSASPTQGTQGTEVGNLAPDFQLDNLEGVSVSLSDFRGNPVMINFWSTQCPPCVREMPDIQSMYEEQSVKGLVLLPVNINGTSSQVKDFLQSHDLFLPVLLDINQNVARKYGIQYIPTTFFIDEEGIIQVVKVGAFPNKEAIENDLNKIMS